MIPLGIICVVFGLIVGSFLNVCIYRIPRGISVVAPSSACPTCKKPIRPWDNIPILSFLILGGRCRQCGTRISLRYPLVELANGLLYWAVFSVFGVGWHLPFLFAFVSAMLVITFIDLDVQIIPDVVTLPGIAIGVTAATFLLPDPFSPSSPVGFANAASGALLGFGLFYLIAKVGTALAKTDAMGGGDIKMMAMVGAFMGWKAVLLTTFLGSLSGALIGIAIMIAKGQGRKLAIPFGPFLALGATVSLFFGGPLVGWYLSV
jgi:leader peptidase (prepilin peptidase)/N-methyltransferase